MTVLSTASDAQQVDALLFDLLKARGIAKVWAGKSSPRDALAEECRQLMADAGFQKDMLNYLGANPVIKQSMETVLAQLAFAAGVDSNPSNPLLQDLAHRGKHLARWLPTFLLIDGPLGRLLRQKSSPLAARLSVSYSKSPLLASARDAFNNDLFRRVRNGFAHWSFTWQPMGRQATISIFHFETGTKEAEVSLLEAEALHYLSMSVIQTLDQEILRKVSYGGA